MTWSGVSHKRPVEGALGSMLHCCVAYKTTVGKGWEGSATPLRAAVGHPDGASRVDPPPPATLQWRRRNTKTGVSFDLLYDEGATMKHFEEGDEWK